MNDRRMWAWGAGAFGCLYDHSEGPFESAHDAADAACQLFELGNGARARLARESYLDITRRAAGADYIELFRVSPDWNAED